MKWPKTCLMCGNTIHVGEGLVWVHADGSHWCPGKTASVATPEPKK